MKEQAKRAEEQGKIGGFISTRRQEPADIMPQAVAAAMLIQQVGNAERAGNDENSDGSAFDDRPQLYRPYRLYHHTHGTHTSPSPTGTVGLSPSVKT